MSVKLVNGVEYNDRHGGPFDRGSADGYYRRAFFPHYYVEGMLSALITKEQMTEDEIAAYRAGYDYQDELGDYKEY